MKIIVGTLSDQKLAYVNDVLQGIAKLKDYEIIGCEASSGVSDQPMGLEETSQGAKNRALVAAQNADSGIGLGLEAGFISEQNGLSMICTVAIYNESSFVIKTSPPKAIPSKVANEILSGGQYGDLIREFYDGGDFSEFSKEHVEELISRESSFKTALLAALEEYLSTHKNS